MKEKNNLYILYIYSKNNRWFQFLKYEDLQFLFVLNSYKLNLLFICFFNCIFVYITASPTKHYYTGKSSRCIAGTHHITKGVAKEDGMTIEQGPVATPLTRLTGNTQVTDYHHVAT